MHKVDVIVLNYNGKHFLRECLTALREQSFPDFQVTLVDNNSTDGSVEYVRDGFPEVHILSLDQNQGFCGGNNRGIEATSAEYVALLNNDTRVSPQWLESLVEVLNSKPEVGFCASKMIRMSDRKTIDTAGDDFCVYGSNMKRGEGQDASLYSEPARVFGACGGAAIYRRSMLEDIGLLDEDFFATNEDADLSFRAQLRGYKCEFVPEAVVYHHVGGHFGILSKSSIARTRRNMLEVIVKNMPGWLFLKYMPWIVTYLLAGDLYHILRGNGKLVFKARLQNLARLRETLAKRRAIQNSRTVDLRELDAMIRRGRLRDYHAGIQRARHRFENCKTYESD